MAGHGKVKKEQMPDDPTRGRKSPEWAAGLRQLYDSVVEEPLPDSFSDLLSQFDDDSSADAPAKSGAKGDMAKGGKS